MNSQLSSQNERLCDTIGIWMDYKAILETLHAAPSSTTSGVGFCWDRLLGQLFDEMKQDLLKDHNFRQNNSKSKNSLHGNDKDYIQDYI